MKKILCIGDLALDVISQLKEPINYGNDTASKISSHPGGQAANVATWITRTNSKAHLVARTGNDPVGFALISDLDKYGVEHLNLMHSGRPTGVVVILVDANGERTMFPDNGANADLEASDLPSLDDVDGVYLSGYALLDFRSREAVLAMIKKIKASGKPIYFDELLKVTNIDKNLFKLNLNYFKHHTDGIETSWLDSNPNIAKN